MPTPAISQENHSYRSWYEDGDFGSFTGIQDVIYRSKHRPASVSNPRRSDRTRAPGNWDISGQEGWFGDGVMSWKYGPWDAFQDIFGSVVMYSSLGGLWAGPSLDMADSLLNNARLAALAQVSEGKMQYSAALAQASGTAKMVGSAASKFAHGLDKLMQGKHGLKQLYGSMSNWKAIPSEYLEYLYGWAPLGDDIANAFDQLSGFRDLGFDYSMIFKKKLKMTESCSIEGIGCACPALGQAGCADLLGTRDSLASVGYRFDIPRWYLERTPVVAPFSTAYELAPYSFVLDWFVPIGDWVGAMESAQYSPFFVEGFETRFCRERYPTIKMNPGRYGIWVLQGGSASGNMAAFIMRRSAVTEFPYFSRPSFKPLPGIQQAAQGLSLLTQAFNRWR